MKGIKQQRTHSNKCSLPQRWRISPEQERCSLGGEGEELALSDIPVLDQSFVSSLHYLYITPRVLSWLLFSSPTLQAQEEQRYLLLPILVPGLPGRVPHSE